ncbi:hypothetical protein ACWGI9_24475 [Streptomyces sp. NPDC054833]
MRKKTIAVSACGALLILAAVTQAYSHADSEPPTSASVGEDENTGGAVAVTRGNISNVLSTDAELVARPRYEVPAPLEGTFTPEVHKGQMVDAGGTLGVIRGDSKDVRIIAKARAKVTEILASSGEAVPEGIAVIALQDRSFALQATVAPSDRYRLTALGPDNAVRASIDNGPGPFNCPLLGGPQREADGNLSVLCAVPENIKVFAGLKGLMAVSLEKRKNALTLPVSAVAGSAQSGQVNLVEDSGRTVHRGVKLGITDGVRIEIRSGLSEGQRVTSQAPSLGSAGG